MTATVAPTPLTDRRAEPPAASSGRTGRHHLLILHAEHDGDEVLVDFADRIGDLDRVTLANLRPTVPATLPPGGIASDLGMMVHLEMRTSQTAHESLLDKRIAARSRLLDELGIDHDAITETYHRSVVGGVTSRSLRKAIGRIARHARADEIVVGPGAIRESLRLG